MPESSCVLMTCSWETPVNQGFAQQILLVLLLLQEQERGGGGQAFKARGQ